MSTMYKDGKVLRTIGYDIYINIIYAIGILYYGCILASTIANLFVLRFCSVC